MPSWLWILPDLRQPVNFHQPDACRAVYAAHDRGVVAGRERGTSADSRSSVGGMRSLQFPSAASLSSCRWSMMAPFPSCNSRVGSPSAPATTRTRQRWSDCAHDDSGGAAASSANNKPTDHDVIARVHKSTRADVRRLRVRALPQIVNLDQADARSSILTRENCGVCPRTKHRQDCRFRIVCWRNCRGLDVCLLAGSV